MCFWDRAAATFQPQVTYTVGAIPLGIAAADFNGDGVPDLAVANHNANTASILLGGTEISGQIQNVPVNGSGVHMIQSTYTPNPGFYTGGLSNTLNVNANGSLIPTTAALTSSQNPSQPNQPVTFTATVASNSGGLPTGTVSFTENGSAVCTAVPLGTGGQAPCTTSTLLPGMHAIAATYSGDQNFATSQGGLNQLVNQAGASTTTTLTVAPNPATAGQVVTLTATVTSNNEPVLVGTVSFLSGTQVLATVQMAQTAGQGTATLKTRFAPGVFQLNAHYNPNDLYQASQSGPQQLTVTGTESTITTLTDQANGTNWNFTASVFGFGFPPATGTASFTDLTTMVNLGSAGLSGPGMSTFLPQQMYGTGANPVGIAVGDFNADGIPDLAIANLCLSDPSCQSASTVSVLLGNGDGSFQVQQTYTVGQDPSYVAVADFNGDGIPDLAVTNTNGNTVSVLLGNGDGTFQQQVSYAAGGAPTGIVVADFNGDGIADLAITNFIEVSGAGTISVLLGNGDGTFQALVSYGVGAFPAGIAVADFNGDGIADLAVTNSGNGTGNTVGVLLGNGDGTFQQQQTYTTGTNPYGIAVGDFNGDGIVDLAVTNSNDDTVGVLLGNGDGTFQPQQTYLTGATPVGIAVADLNGDGTADLAVSNNNANPPTVGVLLGNGNGTFQQQQTYTVGSSPIGIAAADFNGDGVPDLAAANEFATQPSVSVLVGGTVTSGQIQNVPVNGSGVHMIQSTYTPNQGFYTGGLSNTLNVNGNGSLIPTTTMVSSSVNPSQLNQSVTFTATVTGNGGGMPTGTVNFTDNGAPLCTAVQLSGAGQAQCATSTLTLGMHAIAATYSGDQNFATSQGGLNQVVQSGTRVTPTVTLTANPLEVNQGNSVFFAVTVGSIGGVIPTGTVTFIDGTTPLATVSLDGSGDADYSNATLVVGQHSITAAYNGDSNFNSATSPAVIVQVDNPFILQSTSYGGTVSPGGQTQFQINVIAAYQSNPLVYAALSCTPPAGSGITCSVTCPHKSPAQCSVYSDSEQVTVTINTSGGTTRLVPPLGRGEHRVVAALAGLSGIGLVGLVFIPMGLRRRAAIGILFLLIVVLCFGTSCGTNFAPGISSSPVNNTFYISVTADLREELSGNQMTRSLGVQQFWYTLLIK